MNALDHMRMESEKQQAILHQYLENFIRHWAPLDHKQAAQFSADVAMLMQRIWAGASEVVHRPVMDAVMRMPMAPMIIERDKNGSG